MSRCAHGEEPSGCGTRVSRALSFFAAIVVPFLTVAPMQASAVAVGAYGLSNRGPVKSLALSGATVASTDNSAAVLENPAGIGQQPGVFRWAFDYGNPRDQSLVQPRADRLREDYLIVGASLLLWQRIGFGIGAETQSGQTSGKPDDSTEFKHEDALLDGHASLALKLVDGLSLSGTYVRNFARRAMETRIGLEVESGSDVLEGTQMRYGLLWRISRRFSLGGTHTRASVLRPKSEVEDRYGLAYKPEQNRLGFSFDLKPASEKAEGFFPEAVRFFAQLDMLRFPGVPGGGGLYYAPSITFLNSSDYRLEERARWIPRIAAESALFRFNPVALRFWSGTYLEPAYLKGKSPRPHATVGAHLKVYMVVLQAALDVARQFRNQNYGASLELGF